MNAVADVPLDQLDPGNPRLYQTDSWGPVFERLRREAPVHYTPQGEFGPYWSISRYRHIQQIEADTETFSSDVRYGGITLRDQLADFTMPMFIAMDPPQHDAQRAAVNPVVAPANLARLELIIRERSAAILDTLPIGEAFDWVQRVSIELTSQLLATLLDFPQEERHRLTRWSDVATALPGLGIVETDEQRKAELVECLARFTPIWNERVNAPPAGDLISLMAHAEATRHQSPMEFLGNLLLLIVGGNDTTRNSITGGLLALNRAPSQYEKLLADPGLIRGLVPEIIRWQTPLAHMRRTATRATEFEGQRFRQGDKIVLWYISGNRDPDAIADPEAFDICRARPRRHLSFGFGIHRCLGERLAELQLRIMWEEILARFGRIEVLEEPVRVCSSFVHGYETMKVVIPASSVRRRD
jgi:cytochrome P450